MQAKVTSAFTGRPDSEVLARDIAVGEVLTGDLAQVAVDNNWAEAFDPEHDAAVAAAKARLDAAKAGLVKAEKALKAAKDDDKAAAEGALKGAQSAVDEADAALKALGA